jgi:hypothetical protein
MTASLLARTPLSCGIPDTTSLKTTDDMNPVATRSSRRSPSRASRCEEECRTREGRHGCFIREHMTPEFKFVPNGFGALFPLVKSFMCFFPFLLTSPRTVHRRQVLVSHQLIPEHHHELFRSWDLLIVPFLAEILQCEPIVYHQISVSKSVHRLTFGSTDRMDRNRELGANLIVRDKDACYCEFVQHGVTRSAFPRHE